jgi:hypothetical protein
MTNKTPNPMLLSVFYIVSVLFVYNKVRIKAIEKMPFIDTVQGKYKSHLVSTSVFYIAIGVLAFCFFLTLLINGVIILLAIDPMFTEPISKLIRNFSIHTLWSSVITIHVVLISYFFYMYIPSIHEKVNSREEFELWAFGSVLMSISTFVASVFLRNGTDLFKIKTTSLSSNEVKFLVLFFILAICLRSMSSKMPPKEQNSKMKTKSLISTFILTAIFLQVIWA